MTEQKRRRLCGHQWIFALIPAVCFVIFINGGSSAYGCALFGSNDPPQQRLPQSTEAHTANPCLFSLPTSSYNGNGTSSGPLIFSLQQQPLNAAPARLRDDDPEYNKKASFGSVAFRVVSTNVFIWGVDRFVFNYPYSHIGPKSWNHNIKTGWEWDSDRLGMNFFFHPFSGAAFFNSARSNGYRYLESATFIFLGSLMWEYFGETTRPAYNDIINTTVSGALFGEFLYRLTSNILDDRTTGTERFLRELGAAVLSPGRAFGRLLQGKLTRVTSQEIYQKEPLNIMLATGTHWFNKGTNFGTGSLSAFFNIHLDYGDPFEIRHRKPFDVFKLRLDLSYGKNVGKKYLDNIIGSGLLFGKTVRSGNWEMLIGAFQHYSYWDSKIFEICALSFGGGAMAKWQLSKNSDLQSVFHLSVVPLGASNSPYVDIVEAGIHVRNYDYSGGGEAKFEGTFNFENRGHLTMAYYLYRLHTYIGPAGYKIIGVFKPSLAVKLVRNLSLGFEYLYYQKASHYRNFPDAYRSNSEQKLFLMFYF
ncbi:MAG: DUF3943 domain-containing protein [Candidatus Aminicenantales bacterium]